MTDQLVGLLLFVRLIRMHAFTDQVNNQYSLLYFLIIVIEYFLFNLFNLIIQHLVYKIKFQ